MREMQCAFPPVRLRLSLSHTLWHYCCLLHPPLPSFHLCFLYWYTETVCTRKLDRRRSKGDAHLPSSSRVTLVESPLVRMWRNSGPGITPSNGTTTYRHICIALTSLSTNHATLLFLRSAPRAAGTVCSVQMVPLELSLHPIS